MRMRQNHMLQTTSSRCESDEVVLDKCGAEVKVRSVSNQGKNEDYSSDYYEKRQICHSKNNLNNCEPIFLLYNLLVLVHRQKKGYTGVKI